MAQIVDIPGIGEVEFPEGMSAADITAAIRKMSNSSAAKPSTTPAADPWVQKAGEGLIPGYNRMVAGANSLLGGGEYLKQLRALQEQSRRTQTQHPYVSAGLQVAGGLPLAMMTGGASQAANVGTQATRLGSALAGAKLGAGYGAAYGAGDAPADSGIGTVASHTLGGAALGAATGGALGAAAPYQAPNPVVMREAAANNAEVPSVITGQIAPRPNLLRRTAEMTVKPIPEATYLKEQGVPLTAGQLNPRSAVGQIEEASTSIGVTGPAITAQREAARRAWRSRLLREAVDPADKRPLPADIAEAMTEMYARFRPQYDAIRDQPIPGAAITDMAKEAPKMLKGVDARTLRGVQAEIKNALTVLPEETIYKSGPKGQFGKAPSAGTAGDLMKVRENIREAIRSARQAQDFDRLRLLDHAEDVVTSTLEQNLGAEAAQALRATDKRYAIFNVLEDAAFRSGLGGEFGPKQAGAALKKSLGRRGFVQGQGGDVRQLVDAGNAVFESVTPPTGARLLTVGPLGSWVTSPLVFSMNQPAGRGPMSRLPSPPQLDPSAMEAASIMAALQRRGAPGLLPGYAEEDRR